MTIFLNLNLDKSLKWLSLPTFTLNSFNRNNKILVRLNKIECLIYNSTDLQKRGFCPHFFVTGYFESGGWLEAGGWRLAGWSTFYFYPFHILYCSLADWLAVTDVIFDLIANHFGHFQRKKNPIRLCHWKKWFFTSLCSNSCYLCFFKAILPTVLKNLIKQIINNCIKVFVDIFEFFYSVKVI